MKRQQSTKAWLFVLMVAAVLATAHPLLAAELVVSPQAAAADDAAAGTAEKPLKTLARALELAKAGDTILLATGDYPAVVIDKVYERPLTIRAVADARPLMTGGIAIRKAAGLRISGLVFTWAPGRRPEKPMTTFIEITGSRDVEIADCEIFDDPKLSEWAGWVCNVTDSQSVTVRDSRAHHFYFGFSALRSRDVTFRNLEIGPWTHEDGIRVTQCEGPVLIEGCHISNTGTAGRKGGHVDGIQVVYWSDNLTIRNCRIHGMGQGIGAFRATSERSSRRRKNWRIEGNLVYDVYAPHACTVLECDGVTIINNTFPQNRPIVSNCTEAVVKNNICGVGSSAKDLPGAVDYNLWISGSPIGEHDLVGDPHFVNVPLLTLRSDWQRAKEMTRSRILFRESPKGSLAVGEAVEVLNTDGSGRDGTSRKITAIGDDWIEIEPPLANLPDWGGVFVYKWPADVKSMVPDYRLRPDSPAIDSADGSVKRTRDADGHEPTDVPGVANRGAGDPAYLDRGAFEFVPAAQTDKPRP